MKHVTRTQFGTVALLTTHENPPQDADQSTRYWRNFRRDKAVVMVQLISEQHCLHCYSEMCSGPRDLGYHIEHVENKSQHPERTFDYQNLITSASGSGESNGLSSLKGKNAFGDYAQGKRDVVDMAESIHCHTRDCSYYLAYLSDGRIVPTNELNAQEAENAQHTIDLLNLNSGFLQTECYNHWEELERLSDEHIEKDWDL